MKNVRGAGATQPDQNIYHIKGHAMAFRLIARSKRHPSGRGNGPLIFPEMAVAAKGLAKPQLLLPTIRSRKVGKQHCIEMGKLILIKTTRKRSLSLFVAAT